MGRFRVNIWALGVLIILTLINCESRPENKYLIKKFSQRLLDFSFNLFHLMPNTDNFVVSPLFVANALGLMSAGAGGNTLKQIKNALDLNDFRHQDGISLGFGSLGLSFNEISEDAGGLETVLYVQQDYNIKKSFRKSLASYFEATCESVDFVSDLDNTIKQINNLLRQEMDGFHNLHASRQKIKKYNSLLVLSAVILNTAELNVFKPKDNSKNIFQLSDGTTKEVVMMNLQDTLMYRECPELDSKILRMNYVDQRLFIYFVLPNSADSYDSLKFKLTRDSYECLGNNLKEKYVTVQIPKFTLGNKHSLYQTMSMMGVTDAFAQKRANFNGIADPVPSNLYLNDFIHFAYIKIDNEEAENDDEENAVLKKKASRKMHPKKTSREFIADHPFYVIISEIESNSIIMIGTVDDPTK